MIAQRPPITAIRDRAWAAGLVGDASRVHADGGALAAVMGGRVPKVRDDGPVAVDIIRHRPVVVVVVEIEQIGLVPTATRRVVLHAANSATAPIGRKWKLAGWGLRALPSPHLRATDAGAQS